MDPIDHLRGEHRTVERFLGLLERELDRIRAGSRPNARLLRRCATFLRFFVEGAHRAKEHALHKELADHGVPLKTGLIAQLTDEHAAGRVQSAAIGRLVDVIGAGEEGLDLLIGEVDTYIRLHREHSHLEDVNLLPLASRLIGNAGLERLRSRFARIESRFGPMAEAATALELAFRSSWAEPQRSRA